MKCPLPCNEQDTQLDLFVQQIVNNRRPKSYLSNASVHSHSKVSTCLSDVGVTKLGNTLSK
uniref:Uncharacterized protein n=1 Tax=Wolbachia endosymbiont of Aleurodicus floccissimus TaxID=2152762 RepID=A0A3B0J100_9RICK